MWNNQKKKKLIVVIFLILTLFSSARRAIFGSTVTLNSDRSTIVDKLIFPNPRIAKNYIFIIIVDVLDYACY